MEEPLSNLTTRWRGRFAVGSRHNASPQNVPMTVTRTQVIHEGDQMFGDIGEQTMPRCDVAISAVERWNHFRSAPLIRMPPCVCSVPQPASGDMSSAERGTVTSHAKTDDDDDTLDKLTQLGRAGWPRCRSLPTGVCRPAQEARHRSI